MSNWNNEAIPACPRCHMNLDCCECPKPRPPHPHFPKSDCHCSPPCKGPCKQIQKQKFGDQTQGQSQGDQKQQQGQLQDQELQQGQLQDQDLQQVGGDQTQGQSQDQDPVQIQDGQESNQSQNQELQQGQSTGDQTSTQGQDQDLQQGQSTGDQAPIQGQVHTQDVDQGQGTGDTATSQGQTHNQDIDQGQGTGDTATSQGQTHNQDIDQGQGTGDTATSQGQTHNQDVGQGQSTGDQNTTQGQSQDQNPIQTLEGQDNFQSQDGHEANQYQEGLTANQGQGGQEASLDGHEANLAQGKQRINQDGHEAIVSLGDQIIGGHTNTSPLVNSQSISTPVDVSGVNVGVNCGDCKPMFFPFPFPLQKCTCCPDSPYCRKSFDCKNEKDKFKDCDCCTKALSEFLCFVRDSQSSIEDPDNQGVDIYLASNTSLGNPIPEQVITDVEDCCLVRFRDEDQEEGTPITSVQLCDFAGISATNVDDEEDIFHLILEYTNELIRGCKSSKNECKCSCCASAIGEELNAARRFGLPVALHINGVTEMLDQLFVLLVKDCLAYFVDDLTDPTAIYVFSLCTITGVTVG